MARKMAEATAFQFQPPAVVLQSRGPTGGTRKPLEARKPSPEKAEDATGIAASAPPRQELLVSFGEALRDSIKSFKTISENERTMTKLKFKMLKYFNELSTIPYAVEDKMLKCMDVLHLRLRELHTSTVTYRDGGGKESASSTLRRARRERREKSADSPDWQESKRRKRRHKKGKESKRRKRR